MLAAVRGRIERARADRMIRAQVEHVESYLPRELEGPPVLFFNASTRINTLSLNAAFSLLASWALRAARVPVQHVICQAGMQQCMLGTHWADLAQPPPCQSCMAYSEILYSRALSRAMELDAGFASSVTQQLNGLQLGELELYNYDGLELGRLCLPTVRWALRQHRLPDDPETRGLLRQYLISAANLAKAFERFLADSHPRALVVFNGITYPEAVGREVARKLGISVITHEVGLRPLSAFFSHQDATFREVKAPKEGELPADWSSQLDDYLAERISGRFTMAGVRFWPEIKSLPSDLIAKMDGFKRVELVFTNVIFDTSQEHADTLFANMFDWLEALKLEFINHPESLFVIRAHPDEDRPGKESRESVAEWFEDHELADRENVLFLAPGEPVSSYELIERASSVLVYNSSVGLEAAISGKPVLCAGRARYSEAGAAVFPDSQEEYFKVLRDLLAEDDPKLPNDSVQNGRRFLYQELFRESLDLSDFIQPNPHMPGMVLFNEFEPALLAEHPTLQLIRQGILKGRPFNLDQRVKVN